MNFGGYRDVWRVPAARHGVIYGALGKAPFFGLFMVITLHVVRGLGASYSIAGVVIAVFTLAAAAASPWRGRLLDTRGLRRTLLPSLLILPPLYVAAPFASLWPLVGLVGVAGAFAIPWFPITRQIVVAAVPAEQRRAALALDSVVTEMSYIVGPSLGVLAAIYLDSGLAVAGFGIASVLGAALLFWANPSLRHESEDAVGARSGRRWLTPSVAAIWLASFMTSYILAGTDLGMVAGARSLGTEQLLPLAIISWGSGSLVGGLAYGALHSPRLKFQGLLLTLGLVTIPVALAPNVFVMAPLLFVAGLLCAPTLAATAEAITHAVPAAYRGEAMGWQGTFSTMGNAAAPPMIGAIMDHFGWQQGFLWTGVLGVAGAVAGVALLALGRRVRRRARPASAQEQLS